MHWSIEAEVPREPRAARRARGLLEQLSGGTLGRRRLETAKLLVSELVNNAVIHVAGSAVTGASASVTESIFAGSKASPWISPRMRSSTWPGLW